MRTFRAFLIVPFFSLAGCYRYVSVAPGEVAPPTEIRARLSQEGVERFGGPFNRDLQTVNGTLVRWDQDGIAVEVATTIQVAGFPATTQTEVLELTTQHVAAVERRKLDGWRTAGFVAGVVAAAVSAVFATGTFGGEQNDPEPPGEEPRNRIQFRLYW